jgi:hypothetical protein
MLLTIYCFCISLKLLTLNCFPLLSSLFELDIKLSLYFMLSALSDIIFILLRLLFLTTYLSVVFYLVL